jgi:ectoine hydroxylase-related dioxygenase (phytanoyl-CoA dioxygenase family)
MRPFVGNQLSVPPQECVGRHDRGDLTQGSTSQPDRARGESSSVVVCQAQTSSAQLRSEHAILFDQVGQRLPLLTIHPADQDSEPHLESRHVDHVRESISQAENGLIRTVDRVVGQFGRPAWPILASGASRAEVDSKSSELAISAAGCEAMEVTAGRVRARQTVIATGQKRFYATNGYLVVPAVLNRRELAKLRSALADVLRTARGVTRSNRTFRVVKGLDGGYHVKRICDPIAHHETFYDLVFHRGILDVVERLIVPNIQLQQSRLILKPRSPLAWFDWHQDYPAFPHTNFDLLIVTVYLDGSTPDNGCLTVIPGSHRLGPLRHRFSFEGAPRTHVADKRVVADRSRWRRTPVPAGGIEVHHGNLLHSSEANLTNSPRSTLQFWYRAADNVQVGGSTDLCGWGLQVRGVDTGMVRMVEARCPLPGGTAFLVRNRPSSQRRCLNRESPAR